jgi:hypothetical protein
VTRFVYHLCGGPYDGKKIVGPNILDHAELYFHDPYAANSSSYAVYGRPNAYEQATRELCYWSKRPCPPRLARQPEFYPSH